MVRDENFVLSKYERLWGEVRDFIVEQRRLGNDGLPELLRKAFLYTYNLDRGPMCIPDTTPMAELHIGATVSAVPIIELEYFLRDLTASTVLRAVNSRADVIVELGAGWSANLFEIWLKGGPTSAHYFGCELTAGGREAAAALSAAEPRMSFSAPRFDWNAPDYSFIPSSAKHVTVFSNYSIEQIPFLKREVFEHLLTRTQQAESVQGVHMEPLSWQYPDLGCQAELVEEGRAYAVQRRYNLNARTVFEELARDGLIRIKQLKVDAFGYSHKNRATVIHWERPPS